MDLEVSVAEALVRICNKRGSTRGTGFFVLSSGHVLTCHHVIAGLEGIMLEGPSFAGEAELDQEFSCPALDIAVLRTGQTPSPALPIEFYWVVGDRFWTSG